MRRRTFGYDATPARLEHPRDVVVCRRLIPGDNRLTGASENIARCIGLLATIAVRIARARAPHRRAGGTRRQIAATELI
jgi:hypothetical protein